MVGEPFGVNGGRYGEFVVGEAVAVGGACAGPRALERRKAQNH